MVVSLTLCVPSLARLSRLIIIINLYLFLVKVKVILIIQPAAHSKSLLPSSPAGLETSLVGAEGEFVGPEGGDLTSVVTELSVRTFLPGRTGGVDEVRGDREDQEDQEDQE